MKKLGIISTIGAAALSVLALTGCPSAHNDAKYLETVTTVFACGASEEFGSWTMASCPEFESEGDNIFTYEFEATVTKEEFKIIIDERSWDNQAHNGPAEITLGEETTWEVSDGGMANPWFTATVGSTYKITVDGTSLKAPKVKVEQTSASVTPTLQLYFDAVPYDLTWDGTTYTTTATANAASVNFLLKDSNGNYWSKKAAVALDTEVSLLSSTDVPTVSSVSAQVGYVYQFVATPVLNGDGDKISSLKLKVTELAPIMFTCFNSNIGNGTITYNVDGATATGTYSFTYSAANDTWSCGAGIVEFGICDDTSWTHKYVGATLTVDGEAVECSSSGSNNKVENLEEGADYTVTVLTTVDTVKVKIAKD